MGELATGQGKKTSVHLFYCILPFIPLNMLRICGILFIKALMWQVNSIQNKSRKSLSLGLIIILAIISHVLTNVSSVHVCTTECSCIFCQQLDEKKRPVTKFSTPKVHTVVCSSV